MEKRLTPYLCTGLITLIIFWAPLVQGAQGLSYSCSAQIYEAFENSRLKTFTQKTHTPVDLFVASSASCLYRVMQDMTDVAASTRPLSQRYKEYGLKAIPFCRDPLAIIVHKNLKIKNMSQGDLEKIFSRRITNWKTLGGPSLPITLVVPDPETGAHENFKQWVMKHHPVQFDYMTYTSTRVLEAVESLPPGAISFVSRGAQVQYPNIRVVKVDGKMPQEANYPFHQTFYLVSKGDPKGSVKIFADFIKGKEGLDIIKKRGMLPIQ